MHPSSHDAMRAFVRVHLAAARGRPLEILDFGSQMVDGQALSYRDLFDDPAWNYRGLDIEAGVNVDVVVGDAYDWQNEIASDSVDLIISGQALEHVEYFWASMFEIVRVLKPGGVAAIIAPSGGFEHRYPVDCWRFYRDGFETLARYANCDVVDVFTDWDNGWSDSTLIARKPMWTPAERERFARRSAMQRALITNDDALALAYVDSTDVESALVSADETPIQSILWNIQAGALTSELGAMRAERMRVEGESAAAQAAATTAAHAELAARAEAAETEVEAARALVAATEARAAAAAARPVMEPAGLRSSPQYGRVRAQIADAAGSKGRRAYKRLRGRTST